MTHGEEDSLKNWQIYGLTSLDQLKLIQTQMATLTPEFLVQDFAPLGRSQVDAAPPGTSL